MLPSASSLQRVMACTPSGVLPRVENDDNEEATESGTWLHKYLELAAYSYAEEWAHWAFEIPEQYHSDCQAIQLEKLPVLTNVRKEVAYAFNSAEGKGRYLGTGLERDYSDCGPGDYPGTADVIGLNHAGGLVVLDYKTGSARTTPPASENWQLRHNAVCASDETGITHGELIICKTRGDLYLDRAPFGPEDIARWRIALMSLAKRLALKPEQMTYRTGDQCRYCPSAPICPAQTSIVRAAIGAPNLMAEKIAAGLTQENAHQAYAMMRVWEKALGMLKAQVAFHASRHPIALENGKVYGEKEETSKDIDPGVAWNVIKAKYGVDVAEKSVVLDVSKASIERGLRTVAKRGELAGMVREVEQAIGEQGGIALRTKTKLGEYKPEE